MLQCSGISSGSSSLSLPQFDACVRSLLPGEQLPDAAKPWLSAQLHAIFRGLADLRLASGGKHGNEEGEGEVVEGGRGGGAVLAASLAAGMVLLANGNKSQKLFLVFQVRLQPRAHAEHMWFARHTAQHTARHTTHIHMT